MRRPERYGLFAGLYDVVSAEPVYRPGRVRGIEGLRLRPGDHVLDVGCGTGWNFPILHEVVGPSGRIVGVDLSADMLAQARRKVRRRSWANVDLVNADATELALRQVADAARESSDRPFDAVLFTYSLSLIPDWPRAWHATSSLVRAGGRASVVDMQSPVGLARVTTPLAKLACALGGSDIEAHPWTLLEQEATDVDAWSLRGGHIQVRSGTLGTRS